MRRICGDEWGSRGREFKSRRLDFRKTSPHRQMGRGRFGSSLRERMTNQTIRERFHLGEEKAATASLIIATTIEAGLVRPDESVGGSKKFA